HMPCLGGPDHAAHPLQGRVGGEARWLVQQQDAAGHTDSSLAASSSGPGAGAGRFVIVRSAVVSDGAIDETGQTSGAVDRVIEDKLESRRVTQAQASP